MTDRTLENLWFDCRCSDEDTLGHHRIDFFRESGLDPDMTVDRLNRLILLGAVLERFASDDRSTLCWLRNPGDLVLDGTIDTSPEEDAAILALQK